MRLSGQVLSISGSDGLCEPAGIEPRKIVHADYPEYNVLALPFRDGEFDVVLTDQVLEHVEGDPQVAIDECFRVLQKGGVAIHTTGFLVPEHGSPGDFWRFTTSGLRHLCRSAERILDAGGWGNPYVPLINWLGLSREAVPEVRWHPMHKLATTNRLSYHYVVWIAAQK